MPACVCIFSAFVFKQTEIGLAPTRLKPELSNARGYFEFELQSVESNS